MIELLFLLALAIIGVLVLAWLRAQAQLARARDAEALRQQNTTEAAKRIHHAVSDPVPDDAAADWLRRFGSKAPAKPGSRD